MSEPPPLRVALIHDYLTQYGGAEKVLEALHELFPLAPIYTTFYDAARMRRLGLRIAPRRIRALLPGALPHRGRIGKLWTPLYPLLFRRLTFRGYDLVISSSSFAAHHVHVPASTRHICYAHTPPRFLYGLSTELDHSRLRRRLPFLTPLYSLLRHLDQEAARRVDLYIANSTEVRGRIERFYGRTATILYPPVDTQTFRAVPARQGGAYFLTWGRLVASKRVDLIVRAATAMSLPLVVAGSGPEGARLRRLAGPTVSFAGHVERRALLELLAGCTAVLFAAEEDFGIVPVEAMAAGKPVIAYGRGGALETVLPGETGTLFAPQTSDALAECLAGFEPRDFDPGRCREGAAPFDRSVFAARMRDLVAETCAGLASGPHIE